MGARAFIEQSSQDLRLGVRNLLKRPGFAIVAAGSLALGIGAATAMYSVIHAVILDPFPYKDVAHLDSIQVRDLAGRGYRAYYTTDQYLEFARRSTIFEGVIASTISDVLWTGAGEPRRLRGNYCTMNTFDIMGVPPLLGRVITPHDAGPGADPIAILGYKFWQREFGGNPDAIGRRLELNGKIRTVVGVMPPRFMWRGADVYLPVIFHTGEITEGVTMVHVLGRLKPGVTPAQATADLTPIVDDLRRQRPRDFPEKYTVGLLSFAETFPSGIREQLWILFGAVGLLLLIACVNVSNLLLSKATARAREMAVRASLGATRIRVIRQLLAESLVLALAGGALGVAVAFAGLRGIMAMVPPYSIPDEADVSLNGAVLLFTVGVSCLASLVFGIAPALHMAGQSPITTLRQSGRGDGGSPRQKLLRGALVVCEVGLSLMLLVGASLMTRTLAKVMNLDLTMKPEQVLVMRVPLAEQRYPTAEKRVAFVRELLRRIREIPGVTSAAVDTGLHPLGAGGVTVDTPGAAHPGNQRVQLNQASEGYLSAMGIRLVRGRGLTETDVANAAHFAVVNEAFADRYYEGQNALGRMIRLPKPPPPSNLTDIGFEIVGIVRNTTNDIEADRVVPEMYIPYTVMGMTGWLIVSGPNAEGLSKIVRGKVYELDPEQPVAQERTLEALLREFVYSRPKFNLLLFGIFAAMGLVLSLLGIYGVISHGVAQQTQEIGLRIALGAGFGDVMRMVLGRGAVLLGLGILAGLLGSLASVRVLANQVFRLSTFDPVSFIAASVLLFGAGIAACFWPARRAARVDPSTALRYE
jgi:putative ABC transport system permease protein